MKKFFAILLSAMLMLSLAVPAMAYDITLQSGTNSPTANHSYSVYQIFTGDLSTNETTLSNIKYGANYGSTGTSVPVAELNAITDAAAFAKELLDKDGITDISGTAVATLDSSNGWSTTQIDTDANTDGVQKLILPAGYYLIVDDGTPAEGDSYSAYIVQVIDDVTMAPKSEGITSDKVISSDDYDDNNGSDDSVTADGKTSNGAVGSTVNFTLTVNVPANAKDYSYYYCVLNDTLSNGLSFNSSTVVVKVDDKTLTKDTDYKLYTGDDAGSYTFQIAMLDAASLAGKTITVTYSSVINENAIIGVEGNPNVFDVTYSNNPNYDYNDENKNGKPDNSTKEPTGTTPEQQTYTYVTGIELIKVDENGNVLTGAEFTIEGASVKYVLVSEETFIEAADGEYYKLVNDAFTTEAPRTKVTYVAKDANDRDGGYVYVDGVYREATEDELESNVTLYTQLEANSASYASTTTKYTKTIKYKVVGDDVDETKISAYVGADGVLYFTGLGEGEYTITETKTPDGYNTIDPIKVVIDWTAPSDFETDHKCTWAATATNVSGNLTLNSEGVFELQIVNVSGSILPETGGMGTTIFYIVGGLMVVAAVVLLVTKKRMSAEG